MSRNTSTADLIKHGSWHRLKGSGAVTKVMEPFKDDTFVRRVEQVMTPTGNWGWSEIYFTSDYKPLIKVVIDNCRSKGFVYQFKIKEL